MELSTCREAGMGMGPIPWTAIYQYAMMAGFDDVEGFYYFRRMIRALDDAFLRHFAAKAEKERENKRGHST